jgi:hypothetical protein
MTQNNTTKSVQTPVTAPTKRPNETGSISVEGFVKIFDPATQEVFVEKRA